MILADAIRPGLRIVFCGTALGAVAARKRAYYAGGVRPFVLPSTSGAARRYWNISHWQELAELAVPRRLMQPDQSEEVR